MKCLVFDLNASCISASYMYVSSHTAHVLLRGRLEAKLQITTRYYAPFRSSVVFSGCIDSSFEIAYEAEVGPVTVYGASHQTCETQTQSWKNLGSKITSLSLLTKSNLMPAFESPLCSNRSRNSATLSCSSFFLPDNTSSILKQTCAINELTWVMTS